MAMSSYSVAQAKNNLGQLIDRALAGEPVVTDRRHIKEEAIEKKFRAAVKRLTA